MGRAARECSEPRRARSGRGALRGVGRARCRRRGRRCEPRGRGGCPRRSRAASRSGRDGAEASRSAPTRPDPHGSVRTQPPRRAAAGDRSSAVAMSHVDTYHVAPAEGTRPAGRVPQFADETFAGAGELAPGLARPRAPVAARVDEVPVGGRRLRGRSRAVAVDAPLVRAHLEQAEVLAVLGIGAQAGLAARDGERLAGSRRRRRGR